MKPELIKRIARQATAKGAPLRLVLTNGKSITVPSEEFLWIFDDLLGVAHSTNPESGLPSHPTFLDPKEVAQVEILKRKAVA
ncbi:MAG TPA: hypothetical protein VFT34_02350 [Verrucomicrobiae bacterium]|nr:hypothetical protein [Verrucomicrobiae bacterium]